MRTTAVPGGRDSSSSPTDSRDSSFPPAIVVWTTTSRVGVWTSAWSVARRSNWPTVSGVVARVATYWAPQ
ncbi:MAG: hypothetical protein U0230_17245 [Polyangiales bacterium]